MPRRGHALLAITLSVTACLVSPAPPPSPPTEEAALAYLDVVVAIVLAGDPSAICSLGAGTCEQTLRRSDPAAVPSTRPTVIGSRVLEPTRAADGTSTSGGRVLELCGLDGLGERYYSEILVFEDGGRLISTATPYWLGFGIAESPIVGAPTSHPQCP